MIRDIISAVNILFNIYFWLILVRCLCSFIPSIDWYKQPFAFIESSTSSYLEWFRRFIPPYNGIDFSPIVAIIALNILNYLIVFTLSMFK